MKYLSSFLLFATLALAGCASNPTPSNTTADTTNAPETVEVAANADTKQTLKELVASGNPMECTMNMESEAAGAQAWTMYVDGEKHMRGNYTAVIDGKTIDGGIVRDGEFAYNWGSQDGEKPFGSKLSLDTVDELMNKNTNVNTSQEMEQLDFNDSYDMKCKPWKVDASVFTPPSDITFTDLTAQLQQLDTQLPGGVKSAACSACDSAPDDTSKQQCKAALGC